MLFKKLLSVLLIAVVSGNVLLGEDGGFGGLVNNLESDNNKLQNGGFEKYLEFWQIVPADQAAVSTKIYKEGGKSLEITRPGKTGWCVAFQYVPVTGGKTYDVSAWMKMAGASQTHVKITWLDDKGKNAGGSFICYGKTGSFPWFKISKTVKAPAKAVKAKIACLGGSGTTWFDEVKFAPYVEGDTKAEWEKNAVRKYGADKIAPPMQEKVVYFDKRYDYNWIWYPEKLVDFFKSRDFAVKNADELRDWMREKIKNGADGTVCVMAMDDCPNTVIESYSPECTFRKYMDKGGRIVWVGEPPLFNISYRDRVYKSANVANPILGIGGASAGLSVTGGQGVVTTVGKQWGMTIPDALLRPVLRKNITLTLTLSAAENKLAGSYFKNFNPAFPYSGFVRYRAANYNGNDQRLNNDLYRLALYRGKQIELPPVREDREKAVPARKAVITIKAPLANYYRGQNVLLSFVLDKAVVKSKVKLVIKVLDKNKKIVRTLERSGPPFAPAKISTGDLASGEYRVTAALIQPDEKIPGSSSLSFCLVPEKNPGYIMAVWGVPPYKNKYKIDVAFADIRDHLGKSGAFTFPMHTKSKGAEYLCDQALKYGLQIIGKSYAYYATMSVPGKEPELHLVLSSGGKNLLHYKDRGVCLANPVIRRRVAKYFAGEVANIQKYPAFAKLKITMGNDDVVMHGASFGGKDKDLSCYCNYCKSTFKKQTGIKAPVAPDADTLKNKGIISDKAPWVLWMKFRSKSYGDYNKVREQAVPKIKFGSVHGCGAPVFNPYWGLNPPDDYAGCRLLSYYFYPGSSEKNVRRNIALCKMAKMGNREKELFPWLEITDVNGAFPNSVVAPWHLRNQFWYSLSFGVTKSMGWFAYNSAPRTETWEELKKLSGITNKFGPLLLAMEAVQPQVAILASYTDAAYKWYLGDNLRNIENTDFFLESAHISTDFVADEEIMAGILNKYKVLVLSDLDFMTESTAKKIEEYINTGGIVLVDEKSAIKIPGAESVAENRLPEKIRSIIHCDYDLDNKNVVSRLYQVGDSKYLFLVNTKSEEDSEVKVTLRDKKNKYIYNLLKSDKIVQGLDNSFTLKLKPAGGALIGLSSEPIEKLTIKSRNSGHCLNANADFTIMINQGLKGSFPVYVEVSDPNGIRKDYSDYYLAKNGRLDISVPLAMNDPTGKWKIKASELSSNHTDEKTFNVKSKQ